MHRLPHVYAVAVAASDNRTAAEQVTERVMLAAGRDDVASLAERAVLLAMLVAPHRAFAPMGPDQRDAVALARLTGASTCRVATVLGISQDEVRARMRDGLRSLVSGGGGPRTPPPLRDCASAASPGRGVRAS